MWWWRRDSCAVDLLEKKSGKIQCGGGGGGGGGGSGGGHPLSQSDFQQSLTPCYARLQPFLCLNVAVHSVF